MKAFVTLFFMIFFLFSCAHQVSKNDRFSGQSVSKDEHYTFVESGASRFR